MIIILALIPIDGTKKAFKGIAFKNSKKMLKLYHDREDQKNQLFKQYEDQMNLKEDLQKT